MLNACRLLLCFLVVSPSLLFAQESEESLAKYYGFTGIEIFKLERRSNSMTKGDLNGDGLLDVLLVDNSHSRLDLLQQRREGKEDKPSRVNDIKNDWRFEHVKIPVDRAIVSMTVADLNNDGATDIAYIGAPDRLVVRYQSKEKKSDWSNRFSVRLPNLQQGSYMMSTGDLNGDKRDDVVVLGQTDTYLLYQGEDGKFKSPTKLMNTSRQLSLVQVADLDGDGREDLAYLATNGKERGLCARLQLPSGELGPELRFDLKQPRSVTLFNIDETPETEILTIDSRTGRITVSRLKPQEVSGDQLPSRLTQYGFGEEGSGKDRDFQVGDVNGDGLADVVGTDPNKAQMLVFLQEKGRGLGQAKTFPGLLGANHIRIADIDGDKVNDVIVMSEKEKVVAVSQYKDGRLTFPQAIPITVAGSDDAVAEFTPKCIEVADVDADGGMDLVSIGTKKVGRKTSKSMVVFAKVDGEWKSKMESEVSFKDEPAHLRSLDADNDGRSDLLVFFDLNKPPAILMNRDGKMSPFKPASGIQLGKLGPGNIAVSNSDGKTGLLVAQESFARRLNLADAQWQVADQYNAAESKAKVAGSAELNLDGKDGDEIVLVDSGVKKLRVLRKEDNVFRPWKEVELGTVEYQSSHVADFNGDKKNDLLLVGKGQFAVLFAEQADPKLEQVASFETKLERVYFSDIVAGDLNADGRPDLAVIDTRSQMLEVLNYDAEKGLRHAMHFKVFEGKSFSADRNRAGLEPREGMIADVTGDGRSDLLLLAHDRVLLYPQDSGEAPIAGTKSADEQQDAGAN